MGTNLITDQELCGLMEEWEKILEPEKETSTEFLNFMISTEFLNVMIQKTQTLSVDHQFFSRVKKVAISISSIPGYLFTKYQSEKLTPEDGKRLERDWLPSKMYGYVESALNTLLQDESLLEAVASNPPARPQPGQETKIWKLILWSAELWFTKELNRCHHVPVKDWLKKRGGKIFEQFFGPLELENDSRFELLAENNAIDIVEELLSLSSSVKEALEEHLGDKENVSQFNKIPLPKSMLRLVSQSSKKYYIIPTPREAENYSRMYGIHIDGFSTNEGEDFEAVEQKAKDHMLEGYREAGFEVITPDTDIFDDGTFDKLTNWLKDKLENISDRCSILFLSMFCHGCAGHIKYKDQVSGHVQYNDQVAGHVQYNDQEPDLTFCDIMIRLKIEEFLKLVKIPELKGIPKVIAIEACQGLEKPYVESLRVTIDNYPDTMLLMSSEEGEDGLATPFPGFLENLAKQIGKADRKTTVQVMCKQASKTHVKDQKSLGEVHCDDELIPKSKILKAEGMLEVLLPSVIAKSKDDNIDPKPVIHEPEVMGGVRLPLGIDTSPADSDDNDATVQTPSDTEY